MQPSSPMPSTCCIASRKPRRRPARPIWTWPGTATEHGQLRAALLSKGQRIGDFDEIIAAHAISLRAKILQASTSEVYGDPHVHPQTQDYWGHVNPIGVRSCYDEGKRCAETLFFDYHRQHKLRIKVARIFNT